MDEITNENLIAALNNNSELLTTAINHVLTTEQGADIFKNRAEQLYKDRIGKEVSGWYKGIDDDIYSIINEKPKTLEDGKMQKTRDFLKEKITRLKELEGKAEALNADEKVKELKARIKELEEGGAAGHWKKTYDTDRLAWEANVKELKEKLANSNESLLTYQKQQDIDKGKIGLKFNENIPDEAVSALVNSITSELIKNSRIEDGKVIYLGNDGQRLNNPDFTPMSAKDILKTRLKDVLLTENKGGGGNAPVSIGQITEINNNGKKVKVLNLDETKITSKATFIQETEKVLASSGITRSNPIYNDLTTEAYKRYKVSELPRE